VAFLPRGRQVPTCSTADWKYVLLFDFSLAKALVCDQSFRFSTAP
jgi:hypothetical protein